MKTDHGLEERLSRRFAAELEQAGRDYPTVGRRAGAGGGRRSGRLPGWPRAALALLAVAVLAAGGLVGLGLVVRPGGGPAAVVPGADGLPNEIDGQTVYRVGDTASWQDRGDFLLGGYVVQDVTACQAGSLAPLEPVPGCDGLGLGPTATSKAARLDIAILYGSGDPLSGWLGAVVVVHAKGCTSYVDPTPTRCHSVIDSVVWPVVPKQIDGEHVYRNSDEASFGTINGSFLLGGRVSKPDIIPPCPLLLRSEAETQLVPFCNWPSIDGLAISPRNAFDEPKNEIVVARVHVNDPLAVQCPADSLAACQAAIVVESVLWRSDPYGTASSSPHEATLPPAGESASATPNPAQSAAVGPAESAAPPASPAAVPSGTSLGPDGVPIAVAGQPVFRATNLPSSLTYLLGGRLTRDGSCAAGEPAPDPNTAKPPACGFWMIDGLKVGAQMTIQPELEGSLIVVQVTVSRTLAVCVTTPCPPASSLVVTDVFWRAPLVATPS